ncbi:hypothetical protein [Kitasatospora cathayae]|uniref:Uncharacterized protein n=1 Tax=Kitasatospora cathayae TaxID=3004092 RepID=A0ABY7QI64_9ACTN|nr:hypothetical protein [Kitasatospora sp. HUAS 3-15]WBP92186.1 hypothetical protein O1G21_40980 [Kitasatospora sp. HUAS 3-15]
MSAADLSTAISVLACVRPLAAVLEASEQDTTDLRITASAKGGIYIEVTPDVGDEADRLLTVERIAAELGIVPQLVEIGGRHWYQAETDPETDGTAIQVFALLARVPDGGPR